MPRFPLLIALVLCAFAGPRALHAYGVTAHTGPGSDTRLFISAATMTPAPTGSVLWFVADFGLDGVPTAPATGQILGLDDQLVFTDVVGAGLLGEQPGRYNRTTNAADTVSNANVVVYLWEVAAGTPVGVAGQTFGVTNLGVVPVPPLGNADWLIGTALFADSYRVMDSFASVPEPSVLWLLTAGAGLLWLTDRR